jgi:lysophospholipase L1-like esterase
MIQGSMVDPANYASSPNGYFDGICQEMEVRWPNNRTINIVAHGHSVPTGYLTNGVVNRWECYPFQSLKLIKEHFPYAVINVITTSIGGEQSEQGVSRIQSEVLTHRPDVLLIDYGLNDRSIGIERTDKAWRKMLKEAKAYGVKIILLTPTPDLREDIFSLDSSLAKHSHLIRNLAKEFNVALVDSYALFKDLAKEVDLKGFMAQNNHINEKGHLLVARVIASFFKPKNY